MNINHKMTTSVSNGYRYYSFTLLAFIGKHQATMTMHGATNTKRNRSEIKNKGRVKTYNLNL